MNTDLALLSAAELRHLYHNRQLSPVETTRAVLERIDRPAEEGRPGRLMIDIPVEDFIFVVCALIGGGLLLITVLVDDILGRSSTSTSAACR